MKRGLAESIKRILPESIKGAVSNCGGSNPRHDRFAGHLAKRDVPEEQYLAICHALIFPNGVRKTTSPGRNTELVKSVLDRGFLELKPEMRVLEAAASAGLDAISTHALLSERCRVTEYVLGDLHTHVLYDRARGLVFDEDGHLLQVDRRRSFVAMNFSYAYDFQRWTNLPKQVLPFYLGRRHGDAFGGARDLERVPIAHPALRIGAAGSPFEVRRMDVFEPIEGAFDLIVCLHLLVPQYFDWPTIERGIANLASALAVGGTLITGSKEYPRVIRRVSPTELETLVRSAEVQPRSGPPK